MTETLNANLINRDRLRDTVLDLVTYDSISRQEGRVAQRIKTIMEELGATVEIDAAGEVVGGDTGNVICRIKGNRPDAPTFFLCAHMDNVVPGTGIKPIIEGDIIRTDGSTVLGGDDKSGCAIIIEVVRVLKENNLPHGDIEAVFTICEEVGLLGAKFLDLSKLKSKFGLVLDSDDTGSLFIKAPAADHMEWTIYGLAAHAAMAPDKGISAIKIAGEALAMMRLGKIDLETTANIGYIMGGGPTNVVPNKVVIRGEARSLSEDKLAAQTQHMDDCFKQAAARYSVELNGVTQTARVESHIVREYDILNVSPDEPLVQLVVQAAANVDKKIAPVEMMGGCDANVFNRKGLSCANLGTGMRQIHTVEEWLDVRDMTQAATVVLEILRLTAQ